MAEFRNPIVIKMKLACMYAAAKEGFLFELKKYVCNVKFVQRRFYGKHRLNRNVVKWLLKRVFQLPLAKNK